MEGEEGRREGRMEGGAEGRRDGETKGGKEVRREGGREPERSPVTSLASILYLCPLVRPTLDYASAGCDLYTTT